MNPFTPALLARFHAGEIASLRTVDSSRGEDDLRYAALVEYADGTRLAVKASRNSFTTPERVAGWADLARAYRAAGVYCPLYVPALTGEICFHEETDGKLFLFCAEEYKEFLSADEFTPPVPEESYMEHMLETIGRIAAQPARPVPWHSAYCLYDRFCEEDETDETHANALALFRLLLEAMPERKSEIDRFRADYLALREAFEPEYRSLPTAVFQADLNSSNVLLDENRIFRGLIDFNLSGSETILNYALVESLVPPSEEEDLPRLIDPDYLREKDDLLSGHLSVIARHYSFTEAERRAYPTLYRLVVPFRWPVFCLLRHALLEKKTQFYPTILHWLLHQFYRTDIFLPG